jgi:hypothetical protein
MLGQNTLFLEESLERRGSKKPNFYFLEQASEGREIENQAGKQDRFLASP